MSHEFPQREHVTHTTESSTGALDAPPPASPVDAGEHVANVVVRGGDFGRPTKSPRRAHGRHRLEN